MICHEVNDEMVSRVPDSTQVAELLQAGIAAARVGRTEEARQALLRVTELDEWGSVVCPPGGVIAGLTCLYFFLPRELIYYRHRPDAARWPGLPEES